MKLKRQNRASERDRQTDDESRSRDRSTDRQIDRSKSERVAGYAVGGRVWTSDIAQAINNREPHRMEHSSIPAFQTQQRERRDRIGRCDVRCTDGRLVTGHHSSRQQRQIKWHEKLINT